MFRTTFKKINVMLKYAIEDDDNSEVAVIVFHVANTFTTAFPSKVNV